MEIDVSCTDCVHLWTETSKTYEAFFHHINIILFRQGCKISCLPILVFNLEIMWRPSCPKIQISFCCQGCWTAGRGSLKITYLSAQASKNSEFWSACVEFHKLQLWYSTLGQIQLLQRSKNSFTKALSSSFDSKQELTKKEFDISQYTHAYMLKFCEHCHHKIMN
jgi:hypothetical protein